MDPRDARSVAGLFLARVEATPDRVALRFPRNEVWESISWRECATRVRAISQGLLALGVGPEQRCAILSSTRVEWILVDLGILCAGAATTTVYPASTVEECAYVVSDSDSVVVFAEDAEQVQKLLTARPQLPLIRKLIVFDEPGVEDDWLMSLAQLEELGRSYEREHPGALDRATAAVGPDQLATIIYTSGTTGRPKGVELTHDCWLAAAAGIDGTGVVGAEDDHYLWLPLSHSFGKVILVAQLLSGFVQSVDGRVPKIAENLARVRPTIMAAAPRIFEKLYNRIITTARSSGALRYRIFSWALSVGKRVSELRQQGREPAGLLALQHRLADRLVFATIRERFGGRLRAFISGSAPLSREMGEFFHAAGVVILEGYGLTESSAASCVNRPDDFRFGTVGRPLRDVEVRFAEDGELLLRGRGIMRGYHKRPEETAEILDSEGWLHTGDIGELDAEQRIRITDRKKDLIKTSGGKYVAPQNLESRLKALCPYVSQVLVHGDNRNFCTALITLDEDTIAGWQSERGLDLSYAELSQHSDMLALVQAAVEELNSGLASYETIKEWALLPEDLSVEAGDLTPSMKVKRKAVEARYAKTLDDFYHDAVARLV